MVWFLTFHELESMLSPEDALDVIDILLSGQDLQGFPGIHLFHVDLDLDNGFGTE